MLSAFTPRRRAIFGCVIYCMGFWIGRIQLKDSGWFDRIMIGFPSVQLLVVFVAEQIVMRRHKAIAATVEEELGEWETTENAHA